MKKELSLDSVLNVELNKNNISHLLEFIKFENYKLMIYEGIKYSIIKINKNTIFIGCHVSDSFNDFIEADFTEKYCVISSVELVKAIEEHANKQVEK